MPEAITVVLVDDHHLIRAGLRRLIEDDGVAVVGEAATAADAERVVRELQPAVVVLDIGLPDRSGISALEDIRRAAPVARVLMLTVHDDIGYLRKAFEAGASGYLPKDAADIELPLAIRAVAEGRRYVHPTLGAELLDANTSAASRISGPGGTLSDRESEVLRLVALGHTNAEIARAMYLSERTVETHRAHIRQKLDAGTQAQLVDIARRSGLLEAPTGTP